MVSIVDYGMGNLRSVVRALQTLGVSTRVADTEEAIILSDRLILPGVGAFRKGIESIKSKGILDAIVRFADKGRPMLGICLGMQLMVTEGEEFGHCYGLGLVSGKVVSLKPPEEVNERQYKLPHVGWNSLSISFASSEVKVKNEKHGSILSHVANGSQVYFMHSYVVRLDEPKYILATTTYGRQEFCAVFQKENLIGCQFHPEKSGPAGLNILKNFITM